MDEQVDNMVPEGIQTADKIIYIERKEKKGPASDDRRNIMRNPVQK